MTRSVLRLAARPRSGCGPGLGRDAALQAVAALVVERAISAELPCVLDADGLRLVLERPSAVRGARWVVLTPNKPEYARLVSALAPEPAADGGAGSAEPAASEEARFTSIASPFAEAAAMSSITELPRCMSSSSSILVVVSSPFVASVAAVVPVTPHVGAAFSERCICGAVGSR